MVTIKMVCPNCRYESEPRERAEGQSFEGQACPRCDDDTTEVVDESSIHPKKETL